ncbi:MAG TPA: hypothetical protein VHW05_00025 [Phenylobacterium sp.]|jgi:hypothetical protein|nr:hypothetical protein [Phenylobacterium sp.]
MLHLERSLWSWVPLGLALLMSLGAAVAATLKPASAQAPREVDKRFFEGPGLANSGAVSTVLAMLPLLLSAEVRQDNASASLLGVATLLFSITTFLGLWLYSAVAAQAVRRDGKMLLASNRLIVIQGVVVSCMIVAVGCFIAFILVTPLLGQKRGAQATPAAVFLKCSASGCAIEAPRKGETG